MERIEVYDMARAIALYLVLVSIGRVDEFVSPRCHLLSAMFFSVGEVCDIRVNHESHHAHTDSFDTADASQHLIMVLIRTLFIKMSLSFGKILLKVSGT